MVFINNNVRKTNIPNLSSIDYDLYFLLLKYISSIPLPDIINAIISFYISQLNWISEINKLNVNLNVICKHNNIYCNLCFDYNKLLCSNFPFSKEFIVIYKNIIPFHKILLFRKFSLLDLYYISHNDKSILSYKPSYKKIPFDNFIGSFDSLIQYFPNFVENWFE